MRTTLLGIYVVDYMTEQEVNEFEEFVHNQIPAEDFAKILYYRQNKEYTFEEMLERVKLEKKLFPLMKKWAEKHITKKQYN